MCLTFVLIYKKNHPLSRTLFTLWITVKDKRDLKQRGVVCALALQQWFLIIFCHAAPSPLSGQKCFYAPAGFPRPTVPRIKILLRTR